MGQAIDIFTKKPLTKDALAKRPDSEQVGSYWFCTKCDRPDSKFFKLDCAGGVWCGDCETRIGNLTTRESKDAA